MTTTTNLAIPLIAVGQSQKEVTANEAFELLDAKLTANIDVEMVDGANSIDADTMHAAMCVTLTAGSPAPSSGITVELANVACPLIVRNQCGEDATINVDGDAVTAVVAANSTALIYSDGTTLALVAGGSGGGATTFLGLSDTPANYSGAAQRFARVNAGGTGIEFSAGEFVVINETATFTLDASHAGAMVVCTSGSSLGVIVPDYASEPFPVGTQILIVQGGDGQVTISPDTGVVVYSPETLQIAKQYGQVALTCIAMDEWLVEGNLEAA